MTVAISISAKQLPLELKGRANSTLLAIAKGARSAAARSLRHVRRKTPTDQGELKAAWGVTLRNQRVYGTTIKWPTLENDAPHAGIVEHGARPHPVSLDGFMALFEWAKRHGFKGSRQKFQGGGRSRRQGPQQATVIYGMTFFGGDVLPAQVALGIVRKINRYGQEPTYFVRSELPKFEQFTDKEISRYIRRAAKAAKGTK